MGISGHLYGFMLIQRLHPDSSFTPLRAISFGIAKPQPCSSDGDTPSSSASLFLCLAIFDRIQKNGVSLARRRTTTSELMGGLVMQNSCGQSYQETDSSSWLLWIVGNSRLSQMAQLKLFLLRQNSERPR